MLFWALPWVALIHCMIQILSQPTVIALAVLWKVSRKFIRICYYLALPNLRGETKAKKLSQ